MLFYSRPPAAVPTSTLGFITYKVWEATKVIVGALLIAGAIRSFVMEPYRIPSTSMVPTLLMGDYLFVNKFIYGLRVPFTDDIYFQQPVARGDIVVFKRKNSGLPGSFFGYGNTYFIKRIVAVPGDSVEYKNKRLIINGEELPLTEPVLASYEAQHGVPKVVDQQTENLLGRQHTIYKDSTLPGLDVASEVVPQGMYVAMGDNRDNSIDSRFWNAPLWGYLPAQDVMGRAEIIHYSAPTFLSMPRFERIFSWVR